MKPRMGTFYVGCGLVNPVARTRKRLLAARPHPAAASA